MNILTIKRDTIPYISDQLLDYLTQEGFGAGKKDANSYILKTDMGVQDDGTNPEFKHYNLLMNVTKQQGYDVLILNFNNNEYEGDNVGSEPKSEATSEPEAANEETSEPGSGKNSTASESDSTASE